MYGSRRMSYKNVVATVKVVHMRISKSCQYENPCDVTGIRKYAGLKESPKDRCKDRNIGTWKGWSVELLRVMKRYEGNKAN